MADPPKTTDELIFRVGVATFGEHNKLADVLDCITTLIGWVHPHCASPTQSAVTRAKSVVLAVGPFVAHGPQRVLVAPSIRGGVVVTFGEIDTSSRNATIAVLNDGRNLLILGQANTGPLEVLEVDQDEMLMRARNYCRRAHGTSSETS